MDIHAIGKQIRSERVGFGFSQTTLARFTGLTRVTIGNLESGKLNDLGFQKLDRICEFLGLNLGISPEVRDRDWLKIAAQTASTSYCKVLSASELAKIFNTGIVPSEYVAHMITLIEEAPSAVLLGAVKQAATEALGDEAEIKRKIMQRLVGMAKTWKIERFF
ncbi:MAG: helix-turn-helix transcriptional regulator [Pseudomonadota bacterium]